MPVIFIFFFQKPVTVVVMTSVICLIAFFPRMSQESLFMSGSGLSR